MMRKNSKFYLGILLVSGMLGLSSPARSQLVGGVSFDFGGDAAAAITPVFEQIQTAADEAVKYAKEKVTKLKASTALISPNAKSGRKSAGDQAVCRRNLGGHL